MIKMCNAKNHRFFTALVLLALVISCSYSFIGYNRQINKIEQNTELAKQEFKEIRWDVIEHAIHAIQRIQKINSKLIALELRDEIKKEYPELDALKEVFKRGHHVDDKFNHIIIKTIHNEPLIGEASNRNGVLIGFNDKVLYNLIIPMNTFENDWKFFIEKNYNKALASNLLNRVNSHNRDVILLEPREPRLPKDVIHREIAEYDLEVMKDIYLKEGAKGLSEYIIITPAFITDEGDIFGTPEYNEDGAKTNNHKIIVMSYTSLIDWVNAHQGVRLSYIQRMEKKILMQYENETRDLYYQSIQTIALHFVLIIVIFVFSKYLFHRETCIGEDREGEDV